MTFFNAYLHLYVLFVLGTLTSSGPTSSDYIDLGYAKHSVTTTNATARGHKINIYKNIRFAQPPTGDLRFKWPQQPVHHDGIQNGTLAHGSTCISSAPAYVPFPPFNGTHFGSEDCLFLDVYVPQSVKAADKVPVLHWLYGSAYAFGGKDYFSNPMGLFDELLSNERPFVFVTSNYRMGLYGFASSPYEEGMDPNIGLADGRMALEWTQKHIDKFGGNPKDVTAVGQSAGSGIAEMIIAESKYRQVPFQRAFLSSSALPLKRNVTARREEVYQTMLELSNCTSLACLKRLSEAELSDVNNIMVTKMPNYAGGGCYGPGMGFAPFVDKKTVHDLTTVTLSDQHGGDGLKGLIMSNMQNEASTLSSDSNMPEAFPSLVRRILPSASNVTIATIHSFYRYPPSLPEKLAWDWTGDAVFFCHALAMIGKYGGRARKYVMSIPPAVHGQDLSYSFYPNFPLGFDVDEGTARGLQQLLGDFMYGRPLEFNGIGGERLQWHSFGNDAAILNITANRFEMDTTVEDVERCRKVNAIMMDEKNGI
ncbi:uncharacterized protein Z518_00247 [Rhinocladiella mackenziei CBS 650.93]|uniref:Carboxylesterase type B domain-containing protein n=1 Tax=Rhinocladiella mackenziei CBS 650.93 TaxID=1442369 RepID=A0A0D2HET3_9EURO|nr:uncharacterized protein Z518_00247 [Rhinocladiella mackenziei CBS 650.93]KIX09168.1 hypothetical protein Z518_00247 [Rhinocladiella mackenziei CBS 650.93]